MQIDRAHPEAGSEGRPAVVEKEQGLTRRGALARLAALGITVAGAGSVALVSYREDAHAG